MAVEVVAAVSLVGIVREEGRRGGGGDAGDGNGSGRGTGRTGGAIVPDALVKFEMAVVALELLVVVLVQPSIVVPLVPEPLVELAGVVEDPELGAVVLVPFTASRGSRLRTAVAEATR